VCREKSLVDEMRDRKNRCKHCIVVLVQIKLGATVLKRGKVRCPKCKRLLAYSVSKKRVKSFPKHALIIDYAEL